MSIRMHKGYWTVFHIDKPIASFANFRGAWDALYDY